VGVYFVFCRCWVVLQHGFTSNNFLCCLFKLQVYESDFGPPAGTSSSNAVVVATVPAAATSSGDKANISSSSSGGGTGYVRHVVIQPTSLSYRYPHPSNGGGSAGSNSNVCLTWPPPAHAAAGAAAPQAGSSDSNKAQPRVHSGRLPEMPLSNLALATLGLSAAAAANKAHKAQQQHPPSSSSFSSSAAASTSTTAAAVVSAADQLQHFNYAYANNPVLRNRIARIPKIPVFSPAPQSILANTQAERRARLEAIADASDSEDEKVVISKFRKCDEEIIGEPVLSRSFMLYFFFRAV
jgi:hypothetical protein